MQHLLKLFFWQDPKIIADFKVPKETKRYQVGKRDPGLTDPGLTGIPMTLQDYPCGRRSPRARYCATVKEGWQWQGSDQWMAKSSNQQLGTNTFYIQTSYRHSPCRIVFGSSQCTHHFNILGFVLPSHQMLSRRGIHQWYGFIWETQWKLQWLGFVLAVPVESVFCTNIGT